MFSAQGITVAGFTVHWYGILIAFSMFVGGIAASRREGRFGLPRDTAVDAALILIPTAVVCARAYYVLFSFDDFRGHPLKIFDIRGGGLAIYGGVAGCVIALFLFARRRRLNGASLLDLFAPCLAMGQAIGRWGNFLNGEAFGPAVTDEALMFFPASVDIGGVWHLAAFFYESVWCALVACALFALEKRRAFRRPGDEALWYVLLYASERSALEGLRADSLYVGTLRVSQVLSLACLAACLIILCLRARRSPAGALCAVLLAGAACLLFLRRSAAACALLSAFLVSAALLYRAGRGAGAGEVRAKPGREADPPRASEHRLSERR